MLAASGYLILIEGVPVVVLSNNDGCTVARSNEKSAGRQNGSTVVSVKGSGTQACGGARLDWHPKDLSNHSE